MPKYLSILTQITRTSGVDGFAGPQSHLRRFTMSSTTWRISRSASHIARRCASWLKGGSSSPSGRWNSGVYIQVGCAGWLGTPSQWCTRVSAKDGSLLTPR
eukprot:8137755-Pyramimonas_sp.AAC.1